jgi:Zn-dependent alcohol dehydrogenase
VLDVRAMVLDRPGRPLRAAELPLPEPGRGEVLLRVHGGGLRRLRDGTVRGAAVLVVDPQR